MGGFSQNWKNQAHCPAFIDFLICKNFEIGLNNVMQSHLEGAGATEKADIITMT